MTTTRRLTAALLSLVALVAAAAVVWRVLKPAEVLATATGAVPVAVVRAPEVTGRLTIAPLIVDGRIRVYAAKRQLRADGPVDAKTLYTPSWSYRRWPEQLSGVVAVGSTVVSRWSDGAIVALDGLTGAIRWRADGPAGGDYTGLRTGAETVWAPPGMFTAPGRVLVTGGGQVYSYAVADGSVQHTPGCADGFTTADGRYICGSSTPLGCDVARSLCAGYRDASGHGWLGSVRTPALDAPGTTVVADTVLTVAGPTVTTARWKWTDPAGGDVQVLGGTRSKIVLLTAGRQLVIVDAATGMTTGYLLSVDNESVKWHPGLWQVTDSYAAIERLDDPDPTSVHHYFTVGTIIVGAL